VSVALCAFPMRHSTQRSHETLARDKCSRNRLVARSGFRIPISDSDRANLSLQLCRNSVSRSADLGFKLHNRGSQPQSQSDHDLDRALDSSAAQLREERSSARLESLKLLVRGLIPLQSIIAGCEDRLVVARDRKRYVKADCMQRSLRDARAAPNVTSASLRGIDPALHYAFQAN